MEIGVKICQLSHVEHSFSFLTPLFAALSAEGHEVVAACNLEFGGARLRRYLGDDYPFHQVRVGRRLTWSALTTDVFRLARYLKHESYDVLHVHSPLVAVQGRLAAAIARVPVVVYQAHGFYFHDDMRRLPRAAHIALERTLGRFLTDYLITINTEDFDFARGHGFRADRDEIVLAPGVGIDTDVFQPIQTEPRGVQRRAELRSALGVPADDFVITFVGRLVAEKGLLELAEAFTRLAEHRPTWLWLVGDVQASERDQLTPQRLDNLLDGHPAAQRVLRLGRRHDIAGVLQASDLFVLPSYREGMPVALLEAMSCGLPVVTSEIRGCREAVDGGRVGMLVPPRDVDSLMRALLLLMDERDERERLGRVARSFVASRYSVAHSMRPQLELYRRIESSLKAGVAV